MADLGYPLLLQAALAGTCPGSRPTPSFLQTIDPSQILLAGLMVFLALPILGSILCMFGEPPADTVARAVMLFEWVVYATATLACVVHGLGPADPGTRGNGVFLVFAVVLGAMTWFWFAMWRVGRRRAWKRTLSPGRRRYEDLVDVNAALESARSGLARTERQLQGLGGLFLNRDEHRRLKNDLSMYRGMVATLEAKRAKLMSDEP